MFWLLRNWQSRSWLFLIVAQVISTFLVLWFHYYLSYNRVLGFIVSFLNKLQVSSWFDCFSSHKRVLGFTVSLLRKLQARSWCYGLIVTQVISAFLVLWKCTRAGSLGKCQTKQITSYQCVLGFLIWMFLRSQSRSWFYMVWLSRKSQAQSSFHSVIVAQVISAYLVLWSLLLRKSQVLSRFCMVWLLCKS